MNKKQTVLIAGATGFIGKNLVKQLILSDYEVKILTRNTAHAKKIFSNEVVLLPWPDINKSQVLPATYSCNVVVNLAGANIGNLRWSERNKKEMVNSRIQSVNALSEIVAQLPELPTVWIQASAIGYYGTNTLLPTNENGIQGKGFLANLVNEWETELDNKSLDGVRKVYLRFGIVMSQQGGFLKQMKDAFNFGMAICPGSGSQKMSWIYLTDLVEIINQSIQNPNYTGIINVVSPNPISFYDFSKLLKRQTRAILTIKIPAIFFSLILGTEKTNEMLLANQDIIPAKLLEQNFEFKYKYFQQIFEL